MTKSERRQKQQNKVRYGMRVRGRSILLLAEINQHRAARLSGQEPVDPNEPGISKKERKQRQRLVREYVINI